ncbi:MAG: nucleotidyltransferase family protein [Dehalococcoidia bacterium]
MQAIILAGGKGERLRPLTNDRPKGMVEVGGRPILAWQIAWLRYNGVRDVIISCGYLHEVIERYFGDGARAGVRIRYAVEEEPLGRGGGFRYAMDLLGSDRPIVGTNGDIITNLDLRAVVRLHQQAGVMSTDVLVPLQSPYGIVDVDERGYVRSFQEKPVLPYWLNGGIYLFDPMIRDLLPERGDHEDTTFPRLAAEGRLLGYRTRSFWRPADTIKDVTELDRALTGRTLEEFLAAALPDEQ